MDRRRFLNLLVGTMVATGVSSAAEKPNIVYIICDDLGYGDVHCLAPETSRIPTPNADQLAKEGMVFTDAHSGSSVCSAVYSSSKSSQTCCNLCTGVDGVILTKSAALLRS